MALVRSASVFSLAVALSAALLLSGCVYPLFPDGEGEKWTDDSDSGPTDENGAVYTLVPVGDVSREGGPSDLSAITCVSNDTYWAASDSGGVVCEMKVSVDDRSGKITGCRFGRMMKLEDCKDIEGLAFDPLTYMLWASDEVGPVISGHRLKDGRRLLDLSLPDCYSRCRANLSLESLTIREDGLEMWTCNEAALEGDGRLSTKKSTSLVRLSRFVRKDCVSPWRPSGQWAYPIGRLHGGTFRGVQLRGVSDLCVLPDGTLLVLEREFSWNVIPCFRSRIYQVRFSGATDVTKRKSLKDPDIIPVRRRRLWVDDGTFANYEGMCLGKTLSDGSRLLLLVSDGDDNAGERLYSFRLQK